MRTGEGLSDYAAMVECLDENVGRLLAALDELGLAENTMVVFLPTMEESASFPNRTPGGQERDLISRGDPCAPDRPLARRGGTWFHLQKR